uniref:COX6C domain-containing protein n=1 Tax=Macrostomum lignano TaxID=282301 RepID=A0A1I8HE99_9PLAT
FQHCSMFTTVQRFTKATRKAHVASGRPATKTFISFKHALIVTIPTPIVLMGLITLVRMKTSSEFQLDAYEKYPTIVSKAHAITSWIGLSLLPPQVLRLEAARNQNKGDN